MLFPFFSLISCLVVRIAAVPTPSATVEHDHVHNVHRALPGSWYHDQDHPVHELFKRAPPGDGTTYADVAWSAGFPQSSPDPNALPAAWVSALNAAVAAGSIPNIPQSTNTPGVNPVYPSGVNPNGPQVCSATYKCRIPGDIWDSPNGVFASSFDDGPTPSTPTLVNFLSSVNQTTTHFMIGINVIYYPNQFLTAFNAGHDIAVHTWTHPYMTTLSNLQVVGQLGWTMQMIHNSTGGRVPKYWRPPYGDSDTRVSAIAKEVFGLQTVVWNQDTSDWNGTPQSIGTALTGFLASPKSPGLIILEHELTDITVNAFIAAYPQIKSTGWNFSSLASVVGDGRTYQNAQNSASNDVQPDSILVGAASSAVNSSSTIASSTSTGSTAGVTSSGASSAAASGSSNTKSSAALPIISSFTSAHITLLIACVTGALVLSS
ncbi:hypothetical protein CVT25_000265 [Psilocybe cyanescens]|uniref:chitin deacetylase n=1 Tax=Psilocybe cyanescens TaxID=93625 RepID=A0A409XM98_PSICY|nr:hypothetical protein CVT25_000265 [Psilocybe cyanescens]